MKISLSKDSSYNRINRLTRREIVVNEIAHQTSIIVSPNEPVCIWRSRIISTLKPSDFEVAVAAEPEILLLGTGSKHQMPSAELQAYFLSNRIGFEVMTTKAACRTYNLLADDRRNVLAYLILESCPDHTEPAGAISEGT